MERVTLTDGTGRWFIPDKAQKFQEARDWDGHNMISRPTRSQWHHEELYRTKSGRWILRRWSQCAGTPDKWIEVSNKQAAKWLALNDHEPHADVAEQFSALEVR